MFDDFGFETLTAPQAAVFLALVLGLAFGSLAQVTGFCLRRAVVGPDRREAAGTWAAALLVALIGTQAAMAFGVLDLGDHRFLAGDLPVLSIISGGLMFGVGMVLTRGCLSRLAILGAGGNLRAGLVLLVAALAAQATMKGVLAPVAQSLGAVTLPLGPLPLWAGAVIGLAALAVILRSGTRLPRLGLAALIGALVPLGWVGTGYVLYSDFDPVVVQSLSFTAPLADGLFYTAAATALPFGFGPALIVGTLAGAFIATALRGQLGWQSFESPAQTGRYLTGAVLMGAGGVLAGGCTVGAGLSGVPTLSLAALLALVSIIAGAAIAARLLSASRAEFGGSSTKPALLPAE